MLVVDFQSRLNGLAAGGPTAAANQRQRWGLPAESTADKVGSSQLLQLAAGELPESWSFPVTAAHTYAQRKKTNLVQIFFFLQFSPTASPAASLGVRQSSFLCTLNLFALALFGSWSGA